MPDPINGNYYLTGVDPYTPCPNGLYFLEGIPSVPAAAEAAISAQAIYLKTSANWETKPAGHMKIEKGVLFISCSGAPTPVDVTQLLVSNLYHRPNDQKPGNVQVVVDVPPPDPGSTKPIPVYLYVNGGVLHVSTKPVTLLGTLEE